MGNGRACPDGKSLLVLPCPIRMLKEVAGQGGAERVHIAYIDESGDDGYPRYSSPLFVLTCLYLHDASWHDLQERSRAFRLWMRAELGFPMTWEMHCKRFLLDKRPFSDLGLSDARRVAALDHYISFLAGLDVRVCNVVVDKTLVETSSFEVCHEALAETVRSVQRCLVADGPGSADGPDPSSFILISDRGRVGKMTRTSRQLQRRRRTARADDFDLTSRRWAGMLEDPLPKDSQESYFIQHCDVIALLVYWQILLERGRGSLPRRLPRELSAEQIERWLTRLSPILNEGEATSKSAVESWPSSA